MKRVKVAQLVPGMVTAEDVYNYSDQLVLPKGLTLTDQNITKLEFYAIMSIKVEDESIALATAATPAPEKVYTLAGEPSYSERLKASPAFKEFQQTFEEKIGSIKDSLNDIVEKGTPIDADTILQDALALLNNSHGSVNIFDMLQNMRQYDDLTFAHCLNVALICNVFAGWLHMTPEQIELATLCGIFHDIGKLAIPDSIVKKPDKLTDEEFTLIKTHTIEGYRILKNQDINEHIKNAALQHHERCDGTGYPLGWPGNQLDKYAKIVAIADVYDAMTASRVYRGPLCPFKVIEIFEEEGLQRYETKYILTFLENVALTYIGNKVRLSDGRVGRIVFTNKTMHSKPMIEGDDGTFIDLSKETGLSVEEIL